MLSGSCREVEIRKKASSRSRTASRSRVRSEIRRSRVAYERASSSVIRLNAVLSAPISSDDRDLAADAEVAGRDGRGRLGQPPDRPGEPAGDRVRGPQPQCQGHSTQRQQQAAKPANRLIGLGRVDLGDQPPAGVLRTHGPVGHQDVLVAIIDRVHEAESAPRVAALKDGSSLDATSATGDRSRGGKMRRMVSPLATPTSTSPVSPRPRGSISEPGDRSEIGQEHDRAQAPAPGPRRPRPRTTRHRFRPPAAAGRPDRPSVVRRIVSPRNTP